MAALAAKRTILTVQKHALADVRLHIAFSRLGKFASTVTERTIRVGDFNQTPARTNWAFLEVGLSHLFYVKSTII